MKYIVMECHFSYAVLLDEEGKFVKAANRNYRVGQTVTDPVIVGDYRYRPPIYRMILRLCGLLLLCLIIGLCIHHCTDDDDDDDRNHGQIVLTTGVEGGITAEQAREIAFTHAGVDATTVSGLTVELDEEDGIPFYELDFIAGGREYEYEIHAQSGAILKSESEPAD